MGTDMFQDADAERLRLAGWWPCGPTMPGFWRGPNGELNSEAEALAKLDAEAAKE